MVAITVLDDDVAVAVDVLAAALALVRTVKVQGEPSLEASEALLEMTSPFEAVIVQVTVYCPASCGPSW